MISMSLFCDYAPVVLLALWCTGAALCDDFLEQPWSRYVLAMGFFGTLGLLAGCGWFESARVCEEGQMSCDRDFVRVCVVDDSKQSTSDGAATKWERQHACDDDPMLGPRTCGLVGPVAMCVDQAEDGAVLGPADEGPDSADWLRVDVVDQGAVHIVGTSAATLQGAPATATGGVVAAVAYAGDTPVDAALVALSGASKRSSVWLRARSVTRVALIDPDEHVVDDTSLVGRATDVASDGLSVRRSALLSDLPPTLRVLEPKDVGELAKELRDAQCVAAPASAARLELVGRALNRLELAAASALTELAFVVQVKPGDQDGGTGDAGMIDGGTADGGARSLPDVPRTLLDGTRLYVDVSPAREEDYAAGPELGELDLALVRDVALSYSRVASFASTPNGEAGDRYQTPAVQYPDWIVDLVKARLSPMVPLGGTFVSSWRALHDTGVDAGIARAYPDEDAGIAPPVFTDEQAVREGFASAVGSTSPENDFAEYLARTVIFERWVDGPCNELRDQHLEDLEARLVVPLAKLDVLWGLGLISNEQRAACIGSAAAAPSSAGFRLHKATGETISLSEDPQGIRLVLSQGETHVSGTANRGKQSAAFDLMYRRSLPGVIRMQRGAGVVLGEKGDQNGATFSLTDQDAVDFSPSLGGLLVMQEVTRDRIVGHALMVTLGRPMFGTTVLPLVTFRFDQPFWSDTPVDVDDLDVGEP